MQTVIKTDQIHCYDVDGRLLDCAATGQDGEYRAGAPWPSPRFELRDGVVLDRLSRLIWPPDAGLTEFPLAWDEAQDFIAKMNHEAAWGYRNWRLPSRRELFSLVSHDCINPALPAGVPFENVFAGYYWTATTCSRLKDQAWYIHLGGGRVQRGMKHGSYMVWPVCRPSQDPTPVPAAPRFEIEKETVYDRHTGLAWAKIDALSAELLNWSGALDFIRGMNAARVHGHADWRLPNVRELESLIDLRRHTPALSAGHPFGRVPQGCWSSTTSAYEPRYAWVVYLQDGAVGVGFKKSADFQVWAVRGGIRLQDTGTDPADRESLL